jgi:penicillin-binding protein 1B
MKLKIPRWLTWKRLRIAALVLLLLVAAFALVLDVQVRYAFEGKRFALPARLYARPLELFPGQKLAPPALLAELKRLEYRESDAPDAPGQYRRRGDAVELVIRPFRFWDGEQPARPLRVSFRDGRVRALHDPAGGADVTLARLDPQYIGGIYPAHNEDRLLVRLEQVPAHLIQALIAIEDRKFYEHHGIDPRGIARALVRTVSGHGVQGGSTLTQQLVKNFFLTPRRTLTRKFREVLMAVLLELHYDKNEILETYLNEIYLGQDGNRAIHGVGLAAQFYFGKRIESLDLAESVLLVGGQGRPQSAASRNARERDLCWPKWPGSKYSRTGGRCGARRAARGDQRPVMGDAVSAFLDLVRRQLRRDYAR